MTSYQNFIGIDIGKFTFIVALYNQKITEEFENYPTGINLFFDKYKDLLSSSLSILETTGGLRIKATLLAL